MADQQLPPKHLSPLNARTTPCRNLKRADAPPTSQYPDPSFAGLAGNGVSPSGSSVSSHHTSPTANPLAVPQTYSSKNHHPNSKSTTTSTVTLSISSPYSDPTPKNSPTKSTSRHSPEMNFSSPINPPQTLSNVPAAYTSAAGRVSKQAQATTTPQAGASRKAGPEEKASPKNGTPSTTSKLSLPDSNSYSSKTGPLSRLFTALTLSKLCST